MSLFYNFIKLTVSYILKNSEDGLIGNFDGTPVIRHHALDYMFDDSDNSYGVIYAVYKAPDSSLAQNID